MFCSLLIPNFDESFALLISEFQSKLVILFLLLLCLIRIEPWSSHPLQFLFDLCNLRFKFASLFVTSCNSILLLVLCLLQFSHFVSTVFKLLLDSIDILLNCILGILFDCLSLLTGLVLQNLYFSLQVNLLH